MVEGVVEAVVEEEELYCTAPSQLGVSGLSPHVNLAILDFKSYNFIV